MRKGCAILAFLLVLMLLPGCQKTPEKPLVVQKDTEQMIETVKGNEEQRKTLVEMLNAPASLQLNAVDGSGKTTLHVDAQVLVPGVEAIPTVRVKKRGFTQEEADKVLSYFIGDREFNDRYAAGYDEKVKKLLQWKADLAKETDPDKRAQLEQSIKKFESAGIKASDGPEEIKPAARTFGQSKEGAAGITHIGGYSPGDAGNRYLYIENNPGGSMYRVLYTQVRDGYDTQGGLYWHEGLKDKAAELLGVDAGKIDELQLSITKEDARKTAEKALSALGLADLVLDSCLEVWGGDPLTGGVEKIEARRAFQLVYVRAVGGVPLTYADNKIGDNQTSASDEEIASGNAAPDWPYETVQFVIDDTGIAQFLWQSPYDVVETVADASALKSFDDIKGVLSKMILVKNAYHAENDETSTFDVTKARLGLMRITEKNNPDTALLVPVWDFFGSATYTFNGEESSDKNPLTSLLTVNAIDGSVIDRNKGY